MTVLGSNLAMRFISIKRSHAWDLIENEPSNFLKIKIFRVYVETTKWHFETTNSLEQNLARQLNAVESLHYGQI